MNTTDKMNKSFLGSTGAGIAGLCCAGFPLLLAGITGIGLGFIINDLILFPILFIALGFMFHSLYYNKKKHLSTIPIYIGILSTLLLLIGIFVTPIIWIGIIGLFIASIWDYKLIKNCKNCKI